MKPVNPHYYSLFDSYGICKCTKSHAEYERGKRKLIRTEESFAGKDVLSADWYVEAIHALAAWVGI